MKLRSHVGLRLCAGAAKECVILRYQGNCQAAACPDKRFVIAGYSQGAWVVGDSLVGGGGGWPSPVDPVYAPKVAAVVMYGDPRFRSGEAFTTRQLGPRAPRSAVGQLRDGRIVLVAVDGRQPGYSVGLTNFELAQTLVRLGAVTGMALDSGGSTTMAYDGTRFLWL